MESAHNIRLRRPQEREEEESPTYRAAPHNLDAEQALLGAILVNNEACDRVSGFLLPEYFHEGIHQRIYEAAANLIRAGRRADPVTLKSFFEQDSSLNEIGGPAYLARLAAAATTIINTEEYGRLVYELAMRRRLIAIGNDIVNESFEP